MQVLLIVQIAQFKRVGRSIRLRLQPHYPRWVMRLCVFEGNVTVYQMGQKQTSPPHSFK